MDYQGFKFNTESNINRLKENKSWKYFRDKKDKNSWDSFNVESMAEITH